MASKVRSGKRRRRWLKSVVQDTVRVYGSFMLADLFVFSDLARQLSMEERLGLQPVLAAYIISMTSPALRPPASSSRSPPTWI